MYALGKIKKLCRKVYIYMLRRKKRERRKAGREGVREEEERMKQI